MITSKQARKIAMDTTGITKRLNEIEKKIVEEAYKGEFSIKIASETPMVVENILRSEGYVLLYKDDATYVVWDRLDNLTENK